MAEPVRTGEQRQVKRTLRRLMVHYGTDATNKTAFTRNISDTGVFLQTNMPFKPGTTIQVRFELMNREFQLWAKVMWARKVPAQLAHVMQAGMGCRFIDPPEAYVDTYKAFARSAGSA